MSELVYSPLESFELVHYAIGVTCIVCDGSNRHDAERCRLCHAPLALTYQTNGKASVRTDMLAVLGPQGVGKTSYLGMLCDSLSRQEGPLRQQGTSQAVSRGAFSVALQQSVMQQLTQHRFPMATSTEPDSWNWNHLQFCETNRRQVRELLFPDIAGSVIEREIEHADSPTIRTFFRKCAGAIILLDAEQIERGDPSPDFFAMKALSYLAEFSTSRKLSWSRKPIAFVFPKADCSRACQASPVAFAKSNVRRTYAQATSSFKRTAFFAASVAGATARLEIDGESRAIPLRIEPRGIHEPFDWLLNQLR